MNNQDPLLSAIEQARFDDVRFIVERSSLAGDNYVGAAVQATRNYPKNTHPDQYVSLLAIILELVSHGESVHVNGWGPLHEAITLRDSELVDWLIWLGADLSAVALSDFDDNSRSKFIEDLRFVEQMINRGMRVPNVPNNVNPSVRKLLLRYGAKPNDYVYSIQQFNAEFTQMALYNDVYSDGNGQYASIVEALSCAINHGFKTSEIQSLKQRFSSMSLRPMALILLLQCVRSNDEWFSDIYRHIIQCFESLIEPLNSEIVYEYYFACLVLGRVGQELGHRLVRRSIQKMCNERVWQLAHHFHDQQTIDLLRPCLEAKFSPDLAATIAKVGEDNRHAQWRHVKEANSGVLSWLRCCFLCPFEFTAVALSFLLVDSGL